MRILITGPECTGKSTLAKQLSKLYSIPLFPEYARTYLEQQGPAYGPDDLLSIAQQHHALVEVFPEDQSLILDTYLLNLKIWSLDKYRQCDPWIIKQLDRTRVDLVLLCYPDLPWVQDGLRENETQGLIIYEYFKKELEQLGWNFEIIQGQGPARLAAANAILSANEAIMKGN